MSEAYSTKALPPGTVLREWRLEEVLGVGGFGIVYKGRGIYFDELVAIKEYFPSSISDRDEESTVVPIDSNAEEVHALGLKKFVEEAKLLWNLSKPSRHPNIVSVRSLFEIHGTAYMVMDFEDGVSLTELLKKGEEFDEEKLRKMVLPIAAGLERAHRVGVLHRDIKPSNILITEGGHPVLIDFGSARFETEGVTSTTVTFHTPPYAAIEQYVKTYEQGPWTDIYALGIVLYRCITGEKPAEVLERLHGEQEKPLAERELPGYSKTFLAAVDAAMIIKPADRPRSLPQWLAMFEEKDTSAPIVHGPGDDDEDATRIAPMVASADELRPVASEPKREPAPPSVPEPIVGRAKQTDGKDAAVPNEIDKVEFKMVGDAETSEKLPRGKSKSDKKKVRRTAAASSAAASGTTIPAEASKPGDTGNATNGGTVSKQPKKPDDKQESSKGFPRTLLLAGAGAAVLGAGVWALISANVEEPAPEPTAATMEELSAEDDYGPALLRLVELAAENGVASEATDALKARADRIANLEKENAALQGDPARESDIGYNRLRIADFTSASLSELAVGLSQDLTESTRSLVAAAPWADPRRSNSAAGRNETLREHAATLQQRLQDARKSIEALRSAENAGKAVPLAQSAIEAVGAYKTAVTAALRDNPRQSETTEPTPDATQSPDTGPTTAVPAVQPQESGRSVDLVAAELDRLSDAVKDQADQVIRMGRVREPGRNASDEQKQAYRTLKANADAARDYKSYVDRLRSSMRGAQTSAEAESLLAQGRQTRNYVQAMINSSRSAEAALD